MHDSVSPKNIIRNKKKGIFFWITGFSGSGKTSIAKKIKPEIAKFYGPTILISGDNLRKIFNFKKYSNNARYKNGLMFSKLCEFITNQKINVIFATVGLIDKLRQQNRLNIQNYVEIYIRSDLIKIMKIGKKKIYKKYNKDIVGRDISAEMPKSPDIILDNKFDRTLNELSTQLLKRIKKIVKN
jgi:adenylylsulfate kinase|tara:strand:- start:136 stop:687 length:552 start_codon:yes stop_codon:yes gene_type:complete